MGVRRNPTPGGLDSLDKTPPRKGVLVVTGRLVGNAPIDFQDFNDFVVDKLHQRPLEVWDRPKLSSPLETHGIEEVYASASLDYVEYGELFALHHP